MKKILFGLFSLFLISACEKSADTMKCGDFDILITPVGDSLSAVINGDTVSMGLIESASGARYAGVLNDENVVLWNKKSSWMFIINDDAPIQCK